MPNYRKLNEQSRAKSAAAKASYLERLEKAGLDALPDGHYSIGLQLSGRWEPRTKEALLLHKQLLEHEDGLTDETRQKLREALGEFEAYELMLVLLQEARKPDGVKNISPGELNIRIDAGHPPDELVRSELKLIAMHRLGLEDIGAYRVLKEKIETLRYRSNKSAAELYMSRPMD